MPNITALPVYTASERPDYSGLVKFLIVPFLESPESLSVDCERCQQNQRVWVRLAFETSDKGKVYGRGGRNLHSIRTVLETAATTVGQSLYLEIYDSEEQPRPRRRMPSNLVERKPPLDRKDRSRRLMTPRFNQFQE